MQINIVLTEKEVTELVYAHIQNMMGETQLKKEDVQIEVKSKQNYKSEWERASFRAVVNKTT